MTREELRLRPYRFASIAAPRCACPTCSLARGFQVAMFSVGLGAYRFAWMGLN